MTKEERNDTKLATIYELRLLFSTGEKENYTKDELLDLLDKIAISKDQV